MKLFLTLIYKAQMNAQGNSARIWPFIYRCQALTIPRAFLNKRTFRAYRMGLAAILGKPICYNVCVGGNSAAALFEMVM